MSGARRSALGLWGACAAGAAHTEEGLSLLQESLEIAQEAGDSWIASQILKEYARCELDAGLLDAGLAHADAAFRICTNAGMADLAVSIKALRADSSLPPAHTGSGRLGR